MSNKRMMVALKIFVLMMLLESCVPQAYYVKDGATKADFEMDKDDCANNAAMASGQGTFRASHQIANAIVYGPSLVDQCLRGRGWRKVTTSADNSSANDGSPRINELDECFQKERLNGNADYISACAKSH